jgi:hypothetical protein
MNRQNYLFKLFTLSVALLALSLPVAAQKAKSPAKKEPSRLSVATIEVVSVKKEDARATKAADGKSRNVPLLITLKTGNWGPNAILRNVNIDLVTFNSDGSRTPLRKLHESPARAGQLITLNMSLPMPNGIIAERFDLKLVALILDENVERRLNASKSGAFAK